MATADISERQSVEQVGAKGLLFFAWGICCDEQCADVFSVCITFSVGCRMLNKNAALYQSNSQKKASTRIILFGLLDSLSDKGTTDKTSDKSDQVFDFNICPTVSFL